MQAFHNKIPKSELRSLSFCWWMKALLKLILRIERSPHTRKWRTYKGRAAKLHAQ